MDVAPVSLRTPWYRVLYLQVLLAVAAGILVGAFFPEFGKSLKPLGDGFIKLVKMMIAPIIFCTVVHGRPEASRSDGLENPALFRGRLHPGPDHRPRGGEWDATGGWIQSRCANPGRPGQPVLPDLGPQRGKGGFFPQNHPVFVSGRLHLRGSFAGALHRRPDGVGDHSPARAGSGGPAGGGGGWKTILWSSVS